MSLSLGRRVVHDVTAVIQGQARHRRKAGQRGLDRVDLALNACPLFSTLFIGTELLTCVWKSSYIAC